MNSMKNTVLSLMVLLLLLGCVAAGKYLFMPDTTIDAQPAQQNIKAPGQPQIGRYQVSCTTNSSDSGVPVCVIIDTVNGRVVNVIQPKAEKGCGGQGRKAGTIDCNNTLVKPQGQYNAKGGDNGTGGGRGDGSGGGTGQGSKNNN